MDVNSFEYLVLLCAVVAAPIAFYGFMFWLLATEVVSKHTFWWSVDDGRKGSTLELIMFKRFKLYYYNHDNKYRTCESHPDYNTVFQEMGNIKQSLKNADKSKK